MPSFLDVTTRHRQEVKELVPQLAYGRPKFQPRHSGFHDPTPNHCMGQPICKGQESYRLGCEVESKAVGQFPQESNVYVSGCEIMQTKVRCKLKHSRGYHRPSSASPMTWPTTVGRVGYQSGSPSGSAWDADSVH